MELILFLPMYISYSLRNKYLVLHFHFVNVLSTYCKYVGPSVKS